MSADWSQSLERLSTGIHGLDRVLDGGFFRGGVYLVEGAPGAGKTILANQLCFHHAVASQGSTLYVTLLAESHSRLLQHLQSMEFFDPAIIPDRLTYVSGFSTLEKEGLKGLMDLVRKELRARQSTLVVLDGFAVVGESAESDREFKKLVHELQIHAGLQRCTFLLLSSGVSTVVHPVHTMVDGLVKLGDRVVGWRAERELTIQKLRGTDYLRGVHSFEITNAGIHVHPRLESIQASNADASTDDRLTFGIPRFDAMLRGGLPAHSTTMVLGPGGVGKTTLGYKFLEASTPECPGLLYSLYESPLQALDKAGLLNIRLDEPHRRGCLAMLWRRPIELTLDAIASELLVAVERHRTRRLFIDGFTAMLHGSTAKDRMPQFFAALEENLRARGVTTVYSAETNEVITARVRPPVEGISPLFQNLIALRYVEKGARTFRLLSILKMRSSDFDSSSRELTLTRRGPDVATSLESAEDILGAPAPTRKRPSRSAKRARRKLR